MPTAHVNGVTLYYESRGEGVPILGIHGTPSSALLWEDAAAVLARHGRCLIYDRRGFHRSHRSTEITDLSEQVEDAAALLETLTAEPAVVIGRSTGGLIALELARRHPGRVRALVLLEPAAFAIDPRADEWAAALRDRVLRAAATEPALASETLLREALGDQLWEALPGELRQLFTAASPAVLAEIRGVGLDLSEQPLRLTATQLAGVQQRTLLVSAEDSPPVLRLVNDRLAAALPRAEHVVVPGGHLIDPAHPHVVHFVRSVLEGG